MVVAHLFRPHYFSHEAITHEPYGIEACLFAAYSSREGTIQVAVAASGLPMKSSISLLPWPSAAQLHVAEDVQRFRYGIATP